MGLIMKNGISYGGGSGGSGTVADTSHIELTFAEYKELEENGSVDSNATYFITDEDMSGLNMNADEITFNDTNTQMGVNNIQDAIENINAQVNEIKSENNDVVILTQEEYNNRLGTWMCGMCGTEVKSVDKPTSCTNAVCANEQSWTIKKVSSLDKNKIYHIVNEDGKHDASSVIFDDTSDVKEVIVDVQEAITELNSRLTYGTTDLTAGTSKLNTGVFYFVYE